MIDHFPSQNRACCLVFLIKSAENLFEHKESLQNVLTDIINKSNQAEDLFSVGSLPTTEA